jgi:hypothetical protein
MLVDLDKVKTFKDVEPLLNPLKGKSFLDHARYYHKFFKVYLGISNPFYTLQKKDTPFHWTSKCHLTIWELKDNIFHALLLWFFSCKKFHVNLLGTTIRVVLAQPKVKGVDLPIYYASMNLSHA